MVVFTLSAVFEALDFTCAVRLIGKSDSLEDSYILSPVSSKLFENG